jgi:hypothetical protein
MICHAQSMTLECRKGQASSEAAWYTQRFAGVVDLHWCNPPQRFSKESAGTTNGAVFVLSLANGAAASCCGTGFDCTAAVSCDSTISASLLADR